MTNSWTDIDNASLILVWGANPAENHPAAFAHINAARAHQVADGNTGHTLVVIDPRQTRTARQADKFIRIRPGTDIALQNGVIRGIIEKMENGTAPAGAITKFYSYLNSAVSGSFYTDGDGSNRSKWVTAVSGSSKYTDARFIVEAASGDYRRATHYELGGTALPGSYTASETIANFPMKATSVTGDANTVYNHLKAHVAPYDPATVSGICGCTTDEIAYLVDLIIANGRCSSAGTGTTGIGSDADPRVTGYRAMSIFYAMGMTQHTYGSSAIKGFANLQILMGNMGRAGGGINALRGIHNVQGSTDMGLLYGNIPAYSSNPSKMTSGMTSGFAYSATANDANAYGKYMDALWGGPLNGTAGSGAPRNASFYALANNSYDNAFRPDGMDWQQRGFYNMTRYWFADGEVWTIPTGAAGRPTIEMLYDLWPKGNGDDHISMFRQMASGGYTKALLCWGQNPAVTEPNQSAVRKGLEDLDTLVVVDVYETETAACKRKTDGVTYLIPACSHVEEAGSVTNSARALQWREKATEPKGNTKADLELLLTLAKALDDSTVSSGGAFHHLKREWDRCGFTYTSAYDSLYGRRYGWTPGTTPFESVSFSDQYTQVWRAGSGAPSPTGQALLGSEAVCERVYREMMAPHGANGTLWLYTGAWDTNLANNVHTSFSGSGQWQVYNHAKSRDNRNGTSTTGTNAYGMWGHSWLVNRRVLYNCGDIPGEVADYFMGPDSCARLFVSTNPATLNYSRWYRTIHKLTDMPDVCFPVVKINDDAKNGTIGTPNSKHILPGRFPCHVEPYETPSGAATSYMNLWGRNTKGTGKWDLVKATTPVAGRGYTVASGAIKDDPANSEFPLVLTTIRCVEHFQGGPTTRNNAWNVEAEPEPWIEINPIDARNAGIAHGDLVNVTTARGGSTTDQESRTATSGWAKGFRARVDNSTAGFQRVGPGVVAIPWHWGDRGLSTGSRANDLCIDAGDANSVIPEYKACLCKIQKA